MYRRFRYALAYLAGGLIISTIGISVAFMSLPIVGLVWRNLTNQSWQAPLDHRIPTGILFSLKTSGISLLIILAFGTPLAYALARWRFSGKRVINLLVDIPIVLPPAVAGLGLLVAFGRRGLLGSTLDSIGIRLVFTQTAVIMAQTFVAFPFYVRAAHTAFQHIPFEIEQAAHVDGANLFQRFIFVTLPISRRSLLSGALVSWARALGEFGATIFFAGNLLGRPQTMPLLIFNIFETDVGSAVWASLILIGVAVVVLAITRWLLQDDPIF